MSDDNGDTVEIEIPPTTTPTFPIERTLTNSSCFFQRTIGGGMTLKIVALVATPSGFMPDPEATCIVFSAEGWAKFKRDVALDGEVPRVQVARHVPEDPHGDRR